MLVSVRVKDVVVAAKVSVRKGVDIDVLREKSIVKDEVTDTETVEIPDASVDGMGRDVEKDEVGEVVYELCVAEDSGEWDIVVLDKRDDSVDVPDVDCVDGNCPELCNVEPNVNAVVLTPLTDDAVLLLKVDVELGIAATLAAVDKAVL